MDKLDKRVDELESTVRAFHRALGRISRLERCVTGLELAADFLQDKSEDFKTCYPEDTTLEDKGRQEGYATGCRDGRQFGTDAVLDELAVFVSDNRGPDLPERPDEGQ